MKMDKNTKILLGVGAVAVIGYFIYKNNNTPKANAIGKSTKASELMTSMGVSMGGDMGVIEKCGCHKSKATFPQKDGTIKVEYECRDGQHSNNSAGECTADGKCCKP